MLDVVVDVDVVLRLVLVDDEELVLVGAGSVVDGGTVVDTVGGGTGTTM